MIIEIAVPVYTAFSSISESIETTQNGSGNEISKVYEGNP